MNIKTSTANRVFAQTLGPQSSALQKDFPQVEDAVCSWRQCNKLAI